MTLSGASRLATAAFGAALVLGLAGAALASGGGGGGYIHDKPMDLLWRALNLLALLVLLFIVARKPIASGLANRAAAIREELADLESRRDYAKKELAELDTRLQDAESERDSILAEFRALGAKEKEAIVGAAKTQAERIKEQAAFTIEQETATAKAELRREIAEMSAGVAEDLLKKNITADDQTRLVDEYLDKVQQEVQ